MSFNESYKHVIILIHLLIWKYCCHILIYLNYINGLYIWYILIEEISIQWAEFKIWKFLNTGTAYINLQEENIVSY